MITLVVYLKDGRTLSGQYDYLSALARLAWARDLPEYMDFELTEAV